MFDIGFSEIFVIALVALIVIGPERLPKVARTLGHLMGRMQRYVNDVKADISREMELEELRRLQNSVEHAARSIEQSVHHEMSATETQLGDIAAGLADSTPAPAAEAAGSAPLPPAGEASSPVASAQDATLPGATVSAQLELGLEAAEEPTRKRA